MGQLSPSAPFFFRKLLPDGWLFALNAGLADAGNVLHIGHVGAFAARGHVYLLGLDGLSARIGGAVTGFLARTQACDQGDGSKR